MDSGINIMAFSEIRLLLLLNDENVSVFKSILENLFNDVAEKDENGELGINKLRFFGLLKMPFFICEKIFNAFNKKLFTGDLMQKEDFVISFSKLYYGNFDETVEVIFDIFDFDKDGLINRGDIRLLLSYLPLKEDKVKMNYTFQIEVLEEIDYILNLYFDKEENINLERFIQAVKIESYIFLQLLCYLYQRCPLLSPTLSVDDIHTHYLNNKVDDQYNSNGPNTNTIDKSGSNENLAQISEKFSFDTGKKAFSGGDVNRGSRRSSGRKGEVFLKIPKINSSLNSENTILSKDHLSKKKSKTEGIGKGKVAKLKSQISFDYKANSPEVSGFKGMINLSKKSYNKYTNNGLSTIPEGTNSSSFKSFNTITGDSGISLFPKRSSKALIAIESDIKNCEVDIMEGGTCPTDVPNGIEEMMRFNSKKSEANVITVLSSCSTSEQRTSTLRKKSSKRSQSLQNYLGAQLENLVKRKATTCRNLLLLQNPSSNTDQVYFEGVITKLPSETHETLKEFYVRVIGYEIIYYDISRRDSVVYFHNLINCFINDFEVYSFDGKTYYNIPIQLGNKIIPFYFTDQGVAYKFLMGVRKAIGYENFFEHYEMIDNIGQGNFSQVKLGKSLKTGERVAIKIIKKEKIPGEIMESIRNEVDILKYIKHPNIISYLDFYENNEYMFIVLEYLKHGTLDEYLEKKNEPNSEALAASIISQIASALEYLNMYGIIHRDIKLENIMLAQIEPKMVVKLIDFGFSKAIAPKERLSEGLGTLVYVAPEVILREPYGNHIDIWSLGILLYYFVFKVFPFDDILEDEENIAMKIINEPVSFDCPRQISDNLKDLIRKCLKKNQEKRISAARILKHPWIIMHTQQSEK